MYTVYIINNDKNNKKYIGCSKNIDQRIKQHLRHLKGGYHHNKKLQSDFNNLKFNISFEMIYESNDKLDAFEKEEYFINKYDSKNNGYNLNDGGLVNKGYTQSEIAKKKASEVHSKKTGNLNSFFGKKHTEESKLKISQAKKGKPSYKRSEEYKENAKLNSPKNKKIFYYGKEYISISEAIRKSGNCKATIRKRINDDNNKEAYFIV